MILLFVFDLVLVLTDKVQQDCLIGSKRNFEKHWRKKFSRSAESMIEQLRRPRRSQVPRVADLVATAWLCSTRTIVSTGSTNVCPHDPTIWTSSIWVHMDRAHRKSIERFFKRYWKVNTASLVFLVSTYSLLQRHRIQTRRRMVTRVEKNNFNSLWNGIGRISSRRILWSTNEIGR